MTANDLKNSPQENPDQCEDEIELIDLLRVVWKWRYLIIGGTLLCVVVAGAVSLLVPKVYRASMTIDCGVAESNEDGDHRPLVQPSQLVTLIESNMLGDKVLERAQKASGTKLREKITFAAHPKDGINMVAVSCDADSPELGMTVLTALYRQLLEKYSDRFAYFQKKIAKRELLLSREFDKLRDRAVLKKEDLNSIPERKEAEEKEYARRLLILKSRRSLCLEGKNRLNLRIDGIKEEIKEINHEVETLTARRKEIVQRQGTGRGLDFPILLVDITAQMRLYLNKLRNQLLRMEDDIRQEQISIYSLEDEIANTKRQEEAFLEPMETDKKTLANAVHDIEQEIEVKKKERIRLGLEKEDIHNIALIQPPSAGSSPIKPNISINIVLGTAIGFFTMLLFAFVLEYIGRNIKRLKANKE